MTFIRILLVSVVLFTTSPISVSAQSVGDLFDLLNQELRQSEDQYNSQNNSTDRKKSPKYARADVSEAQKLLNQIGYNAGPVDGAYGQRTRQALIAYQRSEGLPVNGEISSQLLTRLRQSQVPTATVINEQVENAGCTPIKFATGTSAAEISGTAPANGVLCFSLATLNGQDASIEVLQGPNVIFSILWLVDARNRYKFTTEQKTYEILVGQLMRAIEGVPFRIRVSVTGAFSD